MIIVSYFTKNTPYEEVMNTHLKPSLIMFDIKHDIQAIEDLGNWQKNTAYKAVFMLDMLKKHKEGIVFLDADAKIVEYPILFSQIPKEYDIAVHFLDWQLQWRGVPGKRREMLSGTMLFRYNPKVIKLCEDYIKACKRRPDVWEQRVLQDLVVERKDLQVYDLPPEYVTIIKHNGDIPAHIKKPIIIHYQASRRLKK